MHISEHTVGHNRFTLDTQWCWLGRAWSAAQVRRPLLSAKVHTHPNVPHPNSIPILTCAKLCQCKYQYLIFFITSKLKNYEENFFPGVPHLPYLLQGHIPLNWWDWSQLPALTRMLFACFPSSLRVGACGKSWLVYMSRVGGRVTKTSSACQHCCPESFCQIWKVFAIRWILLRSSFQLISITKLSG